MDSFTNDQLGVLYRFANNVSKAYGAKETDKALEGSQGAIGGEDITKVRAGIREEINKLKYRPHTEAEKKKLLDKLTATYKK